MAKATAACEQYHDLSRCLPSQPSFSLTSGRDNPYHPVSVFFNRRRSILLFLLRMLDVSHHRKNHVCVV